jgi:hypothetical protein
MPIYFDYRHYCGGLGDFLRSALAFFSHAKAHNVEFYLNITTHPIGKYFRKNIPATLSYNRSFRDVSAEITPELINLLQYIITNKNDNIQIISNIHNFVEIDVMKMYSNEFLKLLELTDEVESHISQLLQSIPPNYTSLHLRCGDHHMNHNDERQDYDNRIANYDIYGKLSSLFQDGQKSILFHCDNEKIKTDIVKVCGFNYLNLNIGHTAHLITDGQYLDTLSEFFIIGRASEIYIYAPSGWVSGFSQWSSIIHSKKYTIIY